MATKFVYLPNLDKTLWVGDKIKLVKSTPLDSINKVRREGEIAQILPCIDCRCSETFCCHRVKISLIPNGGFICLSSLLEDVETISTTSVKVNKITEL